MASVKALIETNKLMIFSKSYCPYCNKVKALFKQLGVLEKAKIVELDEIKNGDTMQGEMAKAAGGKSSVPQASFTHEILYFYQL